MRTLSVITLLAALVLPTVALAESLQIPPPRSFPFDVSRGDSTLDKEFEIREYRNYHFVLQFDYAGRDDEYRVEMLVGDGSRYSDGRYGKPGVIVPIHLTVSKVTGGSAAEHVHEETVGTQGSFSHGFSEKQFHGNYQRMIAVVALEPGLYRIRTNTIKESPEFVGTSSHVTITWHSHAQPLTDIRRN